MATRKRSGLGDIKNRLIYLFYWLQLRLKKNSYRYIFLLAHPRSGSTLLTNILCSHDSITGFGETTVRYDGPEDLTELVIRVHRMNNKLLLSKKEFIFDKLAVDFLSDPLAMKDSRISWLFLIRKPEESLPSLMNCYSINCEDALSTYCARLAQLESNAREISAYGHPCFFLTFDQLVTKTDAVLNEIQHFLNLGTPLSSTYKLHPRAATWNRGDVSEKLLSGRVCNAPSEYPYDIPANCLVQAQKAYESCLQALMHSCRKNPAG